MENKNEDSHWNRDFTEVIKACTTVEDLINYHNEGADTYNVGTTEGGWIGYKQLADAFVSLKVPKSARILDMCAGTGFLGNELHKHGYCNIDALDGAPNMLEKCRNLTGIYSNFFEHIVKTDRPFPSGCAEYDAVLISGAVYPRLISFGDLRHITKIIKKGGVLGFNVSAMDTPVVDENFTEEGIKKNVASLVNDDTLEPIEGYYPKMEKGFFRNLDGQTFLAKTV